MDSEKGNQLISFNARIYTIFYAIISIVTLAVFSQISQYQFVSFDDILYVTENRHVTGGLTAENIAWAFTLTEKENTYWHPLSWISHILDYELFGSHAGLHHWTNLLFHIANALLLFHVLRAMTGAIWRSAAVALLFAVHPINVESVAWVTERKNLLSTFFWFLTMGTYLRYARRPGPVRYLGVVLAFCLGLLSKPMLVTLPFALILLDYWPLNRIRHHGFGQLAGDIGKRFIEKLPLLALSAVSVVLSYASLHRYGEIASAQAVSMGLRITNALVSYIRYLENFFYPRGLAVYYPFPDVVPAWQWVGATFVLVGITMAVIHLRKSQPALIVGWFWYVGTLVPVIGLVQGGLWPALADRWAYVPAIGVFIMLAWGIPHALSAVTRRAKPILASVSMVALTVLMGLSWVQAGYWSDSTALYSHALRVTDENPVVYNNLATALKDTGKTDAAIGYYHAALRLDPRYHRVYNNLGLALIDRGDMEQGIRNLRRAIEIAPFYAEAHNNLGIMLIHRGRIDVGRRHIERAIAIDPDYPDAQYNLGVAFYQAGSLDRAIAQYQTARRLRPNDPEIYNNLGVALFRRGDLDAAVAAFRQGLLLEPESKKLRRNLAVARSARDKRSSEAPMFMDGGPDGR